MDQSHPLRPVCGRLEETAAASAGVVGTRVMGGGWVRCGPWWYSVYTVRVHFQCFSSFFDHFLHFFDHFLHFSTTFCTFRTRFRTSSIKRWIRAGSGRREIGTVVNSGGNSGHGGGNSGHSCGHSVTVVVTVVVTVKTVIFILV